MFALQSNQGYLVGIESGKPVWSNGTSYARSYRSYQYAYKAIQEMERDGITWTDQLSIVRVS